MVIFLLESKCSKIKQKINMISKNKNKNLHLSNSHKKYEKVKGWQPGGASGGGEREPLSSWRDPNDSCPSVFAP